MMQQPTSFALAWTAGLLLLVAGATSCAGRPAAPVDRASAATVFVDNQAFLDANIHVVRSGQRFRLGTVTGNSSSTFTIPGTFVGTSTPIQFLADFIGSPRIEVSPSVVVWAGEEVVFRIPAQ